MKQVVQYYGSGEIKVLDVPAPAPGPRRVVVATRRSLISAGTERQAVELASRSLAGKARARPDLVRKVLRSLKTEGIPGTVRKVRSRLEAPAPLGYSAAGVVVEVGDEVPDLRPGDRVAAAGAGYANHAEVLSVPYPLVVPLPDQVDWDAAAFTTVGAIAVHAARQSGAGLGDRVVVIGLGLVGLLAVQILRAAGCRVFGIDLDPGRCALAEELGAERAVPRGADVEDLVSGWTGGLGADAVLVAAGSPKNADPVELAASLARDRATVVVVGLTRIELDYRQWYARELRLKMSRSYGPGRHDPLYENLGIDYPRGYVRWTERENLREFVRLLAEGHVRTGPLVTHRFRLEEAPGAYETLRAPGGGGMLGALFEYGDDAAARARTTPLPRAVRPAKRGQVRLGVIGAGAFAKAVLLPAFRKQGDVEFVSVCTTTGHTARGVADAFGFERATTDPADILGDERIDAVLVATRHDSHARYCARALEAGKAVFVEKPLANTLEQLAMLAAAWRAHPGPLLVGFNRRFAPMAQRLKAFYAERSGPLQMSYRVAAGRVDPGHWLADPSQGGSRIVGEGCHFVDLMAFVAGAVPTRVAALRAADGDPDAIQLLVEFEDGSTGTLTYAPAAAEGLPKERFEAHADGHTALLDDWRRLELRAGGRTQTVRSPVQDKGHAAEVAAFVRALTAGEPMPLSPREALATTLATLLAERSAAHGAFERVDLTILEDLSDE